jgi:hypothetical protein
VGQRTMVIHFFSQPNAAGEIVALATGTVTISPSGAFTPQLSTTNSVKSVLVTPGQRFVVGETSDLLFRAQDKVTNLVPVTPGSAIINLRPGDNFVEVVKGRIHALSAGSQRLTVTVDGVTSPEATITVSNAVNYE